MGLITKGFPGMHFFDFPAYRYDKFSITMKTSLESLPKDEKQLLNLLVKEYLRQKDYWSSDDAEQKRTLKLLPEMAQSLEYIKGNGLMSFFSYVHSKKSKNTSSHIEDNIDIPEFMDAPGNSDFNHDYIDTNGYANTDDNRYDLITEGVPCDCVFAVEHKDRATDPTIPCGHCHGSGVVKCPSCNGSGRESYEDGTYASGEIRMRTGQCSECGGTGRVPCEECNGKGVIDIFAAHYSVVRTVKETVSKRVEGWSILPGESPYRLIYCPTELEHKEFDSTIDGAIDRSFIYQAHDALQIINKTGQFSYWKKNKKDLIEDNRKEIKEIMEEKGLYSLYDKILERAESNLGDIIRERGDVICRKEAHFCFPIVILKVKYKNNSCAKFIMYEEKDKLSVNLIGLDYTTVGEALKSKVFSLFKK